MKDCEIRIASLTDAEELLNIYAPYVMKTAITFEYNVPSLAVFKERMKGTLKRYPYLTAVHDGEILGYAYTGAFVGRRAYDWSVETTVYVKESKKKLGIGKRLYQVLEDISKAQHILNMNACIGYPKIADRYLTKNSVDFHRHMGYSWVGEFHHCGYKFGNWYNMVWMEKIIGTHDPNPLPVIPFPDLDAKKLSEILRGRARK